MKDVKLLGEHRGSAIFYKHLERDLRNIEFYTNTPCFIYIESGKEVITNYNHHTVTLTSGTSIFLPQGLNLHSDFVKETKSLKAMLVFFDNELITEYLKKLNRTTLSATTGKIKKNTSEYNVCVLEKSPIFKQFFDSINYKIKEEVYLNNKLQELLHLIAHTDKTGAFHALLSSMKQLPPKKNLLHLLDTVETFHLSVNDLAHLSGRSLSSFNRDFKALYNMTAKKWLQSQRMIKAKELLESEVYSVTDVAMMIGYSNVSHFIKSFKDKYGMTPKDIKNTSMSENR